MFVRQRGGTTSLVEAYDATSEEVEAAIAAYKTKHGDVEARWFWAWNSPRRRAYRKPRPSYGGLSGDATFPLCLRTR